MTSEKKITARITENGNGLPSIGELCYDSSTDSVYRITGWGGGDRISTPLDVTREGAIARFREAARARKRSFARHPDHRG